jgi:hypothetical protein
MKYLLIEFEEEAYWIEVGNDGYALRQIVLNNDQNIQVSSLEDCLAEGPINENYLDGTIQYSGDKDGGSIVIEKKEMNYVKG